MGAPAPGVYLAVVSDQGRPLDVLLDELTPAERALAPAPNLGGRQYVLGRSAAHEAVQALLPEVEANPAPFDVVNGPNGGPRVQVAGRPVPVRVSIAHSGGLGVACAWHQNPGSSAGVDVERMTGALMVEGDYLFSFREQLMLTSAAGERATMQLAAWTAKEAAWKALWPRQPRHPAAMELVKLDGSAGRAVVADPHNRARAPLRITIAQASGPDGTYLLALALAGNLVKVTAPVVAALTQAGTSQPCRSG